MGIFNKVIDGSLSLEEAAQKLGITIDEVKSNLIDYMKYKNQEIPAFLLQETKTNRQKITLKETNYIPTFAVQEEESDELSLPDVATIFKDQFLKARDLQNRLETSENVDSYIRTFVIIQKYIDQMAELELEQKYSHKEKFDIIFKFMLHLKKENPQLEKPFIELIEALK